LKRFVDLVLRDLLPALHAFYEPIDFVALLRKCGVSLVSFAGFALRSLRGLLQIGDHLGVGLTSSITPRNSDEPARTGVDSANASVPATNIAERFFIELNRLLNISTGE
jgi:hypothetical protein